MDGLQPTRVLGSDGGDGRRAVDTVGGERPEVGLDARTARGIGPGDGQGHRGSGHAASPADRARSIRRTSRPGRSERMIEPITATPCAPAWRQARPAVGVSTPPSA